MSYPQSGGNTPQVRLAAIGNAWALYRQQMGTWMLIGLITGSVFAILMIILSLLVPSPQPERFNLRPLLALSHSLSNIVLSVVGGTVYTIIGGAIVQVALKQIRGEGASISALMEIGDVLGKLALLGAIQSVLSTIAGLLCVLPAFVVGALLMFAVPLVIDQKLEPLDAIRRSFDMLNSQWLMALLFVIVAWLVSLSGAILCCVGAVLTIPLYYLSVTVLYNDFVRGAVEP